MASNLQDLINRARQRDKAAITEHYEQFVDRIYRYVAYRVPTTHDAEDLTADIFVSMLNSLANYTDTGVPFEAWLFRIAAHKIADFHRRQGRHQQVELSDNLHDDTLYPEDRVQHEQEMTILREALSQLSDEQQTILILRFIEGRSHDEVAEIIGKSSNAVRSIQHRALVQLTRLLGSDEKVRHYLRGSHDG
jgi:RNA polymerase sigma-70 factor (ECF subfamily)